MVSLSTDPGIVLDSVAGAELAALEAWVLSWFQEHGKNVFSTVDRWRGQIDAEGVKREKFKAPALFIAVDGSSGQTDTSGAVMRPDIRMKAVVVAKNKGGQNLNQPKDRYVQGVLLSGMVWRMLMVMTPDDDTPYTRPHSIQFKNNYSKKVDKLSLSLWAFTWLHTLEIGSIDVSQLDELLDVFGQLFPNNPAQDTVPTEGRVTYTP